MNVVICGAGEMGKLHFETFSNIDGLNVVAVSDPLPERIGSFSERGVRTFAHSEEMLDTVEADIAVVATPTGFHAPLSIQALEKGMHVFSEKPMARTVAEGEAMVAAAGKTAGTLGIGYVLRFHDAYRTARNYVTGGRLGRVGTVRTSRCGASRAPWHSDIEAHGGAAFELLTHDLDWLAWALGPVKRVFARGLAKDKKKLERDYVLAVVRFESGAIGHLEGSLAEMEDFYASYEIAGSEGLISYDTRKTAVLEARFMTPEGLRTSSEAPRNQRPFARQINAFVQACKTGDNYEMSGEEALKALRLTAAVDESVQSGQAIEF